MSTATKGGNGDEPLTGSTHVPLETTAASLTAETRRLEKWFVKGDTANHVLWEIDLQVRAGEFVSVIGPSGCGKSTLLKILAGLTSFDAGEVRVLGNPVQAPRRDVGFMFQHLALLPWRNVIDNVLLPVELAGGRRRNHRERAQHCLEVVGLSGYEHYHLREISGGMQQRVALARVLMSDSRLLLLDEPFSALDELTRENIDMLFMDVCSRTGSSAILVTHSVYEAVLMSDRVVVMSPRPARILESVQVPIPRPRTTEVMEYPAFVETVGKVRGLLGRQERA